MTVKTKKYNIKPVKFRLADNNAILGVSLNRPISIREAKYILTRFTWTNVMTLADFENKADYQEYLEELRNNVEKWLIGYLSDDDLMSEYNNDDCIGVFNAIPLICYLQKKEII